MDSDPTRAAIAQLLRADGRLKPWIERIGPLALPRRQRFGLVDALARSILYQQLHGKAAATIVGRVETALGSRRIDAEGLSRLSVEQLRGAGVSGGKAAALKDLAEHARRRRLPSVAQLDQMSEQQIVDALTVVRGIGPWTVHMLLIFKLARPDVLPDSDYGVRAGAQLVHGLEQLPNAEQLRTLAKAWSPLRSLASLYLWRAIDLSRETGTT